MNGGRRTPVVRVGDTVRRPLHARSEFVQAVLLHLEAVGFDGSPRFLGVDEEGREVLSYIEGEVVEGDAAGRTGPQAIFEDLIAWMDRNGPTLV